MTRIHWLDSARGIGIILVVVGHALGGLIDSPLGADLDGLRRLFFVIYTFHMPLFFLLSGLLVPQRIEKGQGAFLRSLLPKIVWPYFLWSFVQFNIIYAAGTLVNRPFETYWPIILSLPWNVFSQFWFLYVLFWGHIFAVLLLPKIGADGFVMVALALKALILVIALPITVQRVFDHMLFYGVGVLLTTSGIESIIIRHKRWVRAFLIPALAVGAISVTLAATPQYGADIPLTGAESSDIANLAWRFPALAAAVFGVAAVMALASLPRMADARLLQWLGRMTMPIFLLHVIFVAGTRIVSIFFGIVTDPVSLLVLSVVIGITGPLIVEQITRKLGLNRWLGFQ